MPERSPTIAGFATGMKSTVLPLVVIAGAILIGLAYRKRKT